MMTGAKKTRNKMQLSTNKEIEETIPLAQATAESVEKSWLDSLTPEELAIEDQRREGRQKKADIAKQNQEFEQNLRAKREHELKMSVIKDARLSAGKEQEKMQAKAEGVLEAQQFGDGDWYVDLDDGLWKKMDHAFWCRHCETGMNEAAISDHIRGDRHRKHRAPIGSSLPSSLPSPCRASAACCQSPGSRPAYPEKWQEIGADGLLRCLPCNKVCDGVHETTADHMKRLWAYDITLEGDYKEPDEAWLAWMPCEEWGEGRYLKCLLCDKWIQDLAGTDPRGYDGHHSRLSAKNQKAHRKKMESLDHYKQDHAFWNTLLAERSIWHPGPPAKPLASANTSASKPPSVPEVPEGWAATWSEEHQAHYYHSDFDQAQWEMPTLSAEIMC